MTHWGSQGSSVPWRPHCPAMSHCDTPAQQHRIRLSITGKKLDCGRCRLGMMCLLIDLPDCVAHAAQINISTLHASGCKIVNAS